MKNSSLNNRKPHLLKTIGKKLAASRGRKGYRVYKDIRGLSERIKLHLYKLRRKPFKKVKVWQTCFDRPHITQNEAYLLGLICELVGTIQIRKDYLDMDERVRLGFEVVGDRDKVHVTRKLFLYLISRLDSSLKALKRAFFFKNQNERKKRRLKKKGLRSRRVKIKPLYSISKNRSKIRLMSFIYSLTELKSLLEQSPGLGVSASDYRVLTKYINSEYKLTPTRKKNIDRVDFKNPLRLFVGKSNLQIQKPNVSSITSKVQRMYGQVESLGLPNRQS